MHTPTILNPPSLEACKNAARNNAMRTPKPKDGHVRMMARFDGEEREMRLFVTDAWAYGEDKAPPALRETEYAIEGRLEHEMIMFEVLVIIDTATAIGYFRKCSSFPPELVNLWPFLPANNALRRPPAPDPEPADTGVTAEMLMHKVTDIPELKDYVIYCAKRGIVYLFEVCMIDYKPRKNDKQFSLNTLREVLATLGIPISFRTTMIDVHPPYWDDPDFLRAIALPAKEGLTRCYTKEEGEVLMGEWLRPRGSRKGPKNLFSGNLEYAQKLIRPGTGLRAVMLIPPDWKPPSPG